MQFVLSMFVPERLLVMLLAACVSCWLLVIEGFRSIVNQKFPTDANKKAKI
jgi:hypothetical protein